MLESAEPTQPTPEETAIDQIGGEVFSLWSSMDQTAASMVGGITERIASPLPSDSERVTSKAVGWDVRLDAIDPDGLRSTAELTRRFLRFEIDKLAQASKLHRFDLQITPYRIGFTLAEVHHHLKSFSFANSAHLERYAALVRQYHVFLAATLDDLRQQVAEGIVVPASALPGCLGAIKGLAAAVVQNVRVTSERLAHIPQAQRAAFSGRLERDLEGLRAAFSELTGYIEGDYCRKATARLGLFQYAGGRDAYDTLIHHHTTLPLSADELHRRGVDLVREIEEDMAAVRSQLGFEGSRSDFLQQIKSNPRFYCETADEMEQLYLKYMRKCEAAIPKAFGKQTFPRYGVKRLAAESEGGMTFGYYQPVGLARGDVGCYLYNGSNLDQRSTISAAAVIYHELVPGHHLHLSTEMGNASRSLVRRLPTITAFSEGWAEYASDLGFELGLYEDPYDRYGRYLIQVFAASRMVVDTGLNALGWTAQRARDYLLEHTAQSLTEIESEILRYGAAMPGQALAYAPGRLQFWQARRAAEQRMGSRFELSAFHRVILNGGSLPLMDLSFSVERWSSSDLNTEKAQ